MCAVLGHLNEKKNMYNLTPSLKLAVVLRKNNSIDIKLDRGCVCKHAGVMYTFSRQRCVPYESQGVLSNVNKAS